MVRIKRERTNVIQFNFFIKSSKLSVINEALINSFLILTVNTSHFQFKYFIIIVGVVGNLVLIFLIQYGAKPADGKYPKPASALVSTLKCQISAVPDGGPRSRVYAR